MGQIIIDFNGICMHVSAEKTHLLPPGVRHRVVLPQASSGFHYVSDGIGHCIPPHVPILALVAQDTDGTTPLSSLIERTDGALAGLKQVAAGSWRMHGVRLSIANAVSKRLTTANMDILPSLSDRAVPEGAQPPVLNLKSNVVAGQHAAALFDITDGDLTAHWIESDPELGVAFTRLVADTEGKPQLTVRTFYDDRDSTIHFAGEVVNLVVDNTGEMSDTIWDFVLHYFAVDVIPPTIRPPGGLGHNGLTSGCSNSNYP